MKTKEDILKHHTQINKLQLAEFHYNKGEANKIQTSGHFVLFEDAVVAMQEYADQHLQSKLAEVNGLPDDALITDYWKRKNCFGHYLEGLEHGSQWMRSEAAKVIAKMQQP